MLPRLLAAALSLNRIGFGLAYLLTPARAGRGWIGGIARVPAAQVFIRGHGARDLALGTGALAILASREPERARAWMAAQALADAADVGSTLTARRRLPEQGFRFALLMSSASTAVAGAAWALLGRGAHSPEG